MMSDPLQLFKHILRVYITNAMSTSSGWKGTIQFNSIQIAFYWYDKNINVVLPKHEDNKDTSL